MTMRQAHRAGEKLFVDYAGDTVPVIIDRLTGQNATPNFRGITQRSYLRLSASSFCVSARSQSSFTSVARITAGSV